MKTFLLLAGLFFSTTVLTAGVPEAVKAAFQKDYPAAEVFLWEQNKEGCIATFRDEEGLKKAIYTDQGQWVETRTRIITRDIPTDVMRNIRKTTGVVRMTYIGRVMTPNGKFYRIESETAEEVVVMIFDENGELTSQETFAFSVSKA